MKINKKNNYDDENDDESLSDLDTDYSRIKINFVNKATNDLLVRLSKDAK